MRSDLIPARIWVKFHSRICVEFAVNLFTKQSPFLIMYLYPAKVPLDLLQLPRQTGRSLAASNMAEHVKTVQDKVQQALVASNSNYKNAADKTLHKNVFKVCDSVMVYMQKEQFPMGMYNKL